MLTFDELVELGKKDPEALILYLKEENKRQGVVSFLNLEEHVEAFLVVIKGGGYE